MEQVIVREVVGTVVINRDETTVVLTREVAAGPPGPAGPAGKSGDREGLIIDQTVPSALWSIAHNLGYYPVVTVVDGGGEIMFANVKHVSTNLVTISFGQPTAGSAIIV